MSKNNKHNKNKVSDSSKSEKTNFKESENQNTDSLKLYEQFLNNEEPQEVVPEEQTPKIVTPIVNPKIKLSEDDRKLLMIREILFGEQLGELQHNLDEVQHDLGDIKEVTIDEGGFERKLEPHLRMQVKYIRDNFSDLFGESIAVSVKRQIKDSKDEVVEALYPILGAMLRRAIAKEFKLLNERFEKTANQIFKLAFWKTKFKGLITGIDHTEVFLQELYQSKIEDIFVIQKGSGLLIGKYVLEDTEIDRDVVAGALTAVKGFAESALGKQSVELEKIDYGDYAILLHNYHKFYFAVLCSGTVGNFFISDVNEKIVTFTSQYLSELPDRIDSTLFKNNSKLLQKYF